MSDLSSINEQLQVEVQQLCLALSEQNVAETRALQGKMATMGLELKALKKREKE